MSRIDAVRFHIAVARLHLAAGPAGRGLAVDPRRRRLAGARPSFAQYTLEAHAGVPEVCLALLERGAVRRLAEADELRAIEAAAVRRLRRYARTYPMARPRALICLGSWQALRDAGGRRPGPGPGPSRRPSAWPCHRSWPGASYQLGRNLGPGEHAPNGLDQAALLERAAAGFEAMGCRVEAESARDLAAGRSVERSR